MLLVLDMHLNIPKDSFFLQFFFIEFTFQNN
jgi:hypothetical protein